MTYKTFVSELTEMGATLADFSESTYVIVKGNKDANVEILADNEDDEEAQIFFYAMDWDSQKGYDRLYKEFGKAIRAIKKYFK